MNADTSLSPRCPREILREYFCRPTINTQSISVGLQKYKMSISVGVRGTEALATTKTSDVTGHGTRALIWGMT